jgi:hypothetical protein
VGLDHADHHVHALPLQLARGGQHRVGLADAGRGAEKDLQPMGALVVFGAQQGIGTCFAGFGHATPVKGVSCADYQACQCPVNVTLR